MAVYGYSRVSTKQQSLSLQINSLNATGISEIFCDVFSGKSNLIEGPEWQRLMEKVKPGDMIRVWKMDRLSRDLVQAVQVAKELREKGVIVESVTEGYTTQDSLVFHITMAVVQHEREKIVERIKAGIKASKKKSGKPRMVNPPTAKVSFLVNRHGYSVKKACKKVGISVSSYYKYRK